MWCGWGLGGEAASLPGFAVKNSKTGPRGGCASMTHILNILIYFYVHGNVLIWLPGSCTDFYFFHLICFFSCTFCFCLSLFSYRTTVVCNMATNKWYIYIYINRWQVKSPTRGPIMIFTWLILWVNLEQTAFPGDLRRNDTHLASL